MKRFSFLFFLFLIIAVCSGCTGSVSNSADSNDFTIVATNFVGYDIAKSIVGENADVVMLLSPGEETHSFDPTPADIITIQNSDVFLYVGGESDDWIRNILSSMEESDMIAISFMDQVSLYEEEHKEGMMESRGHDHEHEHDADSCELDHDHDSVDDEIMDGDREHNEYDEHVWTSVRNAIYLVNAVVEAASDAKPECSDLFHENAENYISQLEDLDHAYHEVVDNADRKWLLFGDRFPFLYMMKEYGLDYYAAFPGCSSETEPNAATIAFLIDKGQDYDVPVVLKESLSNGNIASAIAEEIDAEVMTMYSCDNIPANDFEQGESYLSLMRKNLEVLKEALNK